MSRHQKEQSFFHQVEIDSEMLLPEFEVYRPISRVLPTLEESLSLSNDISTVSKIVLEKNIPETFELLEGGIFNHATFLQSMPGENSNEGTVVSFWEKSKFLRNTTIALLIGQMADRFYGRFSRKQQPNSLDEQVINPFIELKKLTTELGSGRDTNLQEKLRNVKKITDFLNIQLKKELLQVLDEASNLDATHPFKSLHQNLTTFVLFSNHWNLVRKQKAFFTANEFISRGIDSMTAVPYQMVQLLYTILGEDTPAEKILNVYEKSYPMLAFFASGDREIFGQLRRVLEDSNDLFDPQYFYIKNGTSLLPTPKALEVKEIEVRKNNYHFMRTESIWFRGKPRVVTYCPAVVARWNQKNVIREIHQTTLEMFRYILV